MRAIVTVLPDPRSVAEAAAERFVAAAGAAVADRGRFTVAFSGGSTPTGLYALLATPDYQARVPWDATHVFWADERHVPPDGAESNYRLVGRALLSKLRVPPGGVHRVPTELEPAAAAEAYSQTLAAVLGNEGLDLVLLGLGEDGHTASLFPGGTAVYAARRGAVTTKAPQLGTRRVTLTIPEINAARSVLFIVTGPTKAPAVAHLRTGMSGLPAERIRPVGGTVEWLLDAAAAGQADYGLGTHARGPQRPFGVDAMKRQAAEAAVELVSPGMTVGLGTGSTVRFVVQALGRRLAEGDLADVTAVATSRRTESLAREVGIPLVDLEGGRSLDLAIDGADEISPELDLLKGGGGALLREKIVAAAARRLVVVADGAKRVARLGTRAPLPVVVVPFGWPIHLDVLRALGAEPELRRGPDGEPAVTDDSLYLLDCRFAGGIDDPAALSAELGARPGVVDTGLFLGLADTAFVASESGLSILRRR